MPKMSRDTKAVVGEGKSGCLSVKDLRQTFPLEGNHFSVEFYRDLKERRGRQQASRAVALEVPEATVSTDEGPDEVEEVFELELDWTPEKVDLARVLEEVAKEKGPARSRHGGDRPDRPECPASASCACSMCRPKLPFGAGAAGAAGNAKGSLSESPPPKRVMLSSDTFSTSEKECARGAIRFLGCDAFYEYSAEAYAAKLSRDDRYWFGCHAALAIQPDLTPGMRKTLYLWLVAVVRQFNFTLETWCITVSLVDRFLALQPIRQDCLQLAGLSAFFIAAKAEEVEPPEIRELVSLCDYCYDRTQFLWMEYIMLTHLKFEILSPTTAFFLHHQVELAKLHDSWPYELSAWLIQLLLCDEWLSNISPSVLASWIFTVVVENWCPKVFVDMDLVDHLMDTIRYAVLA